MQTINNAEAAANDDTNRERTKSGCVIMEKALHDDFVQPTPTKRPTAAADHLFAQQQQFPLNFGIFEREYNFNF